MKESKGRHAAVGVVLMQERCRNRLGSRKGTISELRASARLEGRSSLAPRVLKGERLGEHGP
jgi:hypothetical protein